MQRGISSGSEGELREGDTVYIFGHGPGVLLKKKKRGSKNKYQVRYPNGATYHVTREQILIHQPARSTSHGSGTIASPQVGPRQVEYLGRSFNDPDRTMPAPAAIFSLVATMVGGGVLSLPYAMSQCGIVLGTLSLFASGAATFWTLTMLVECARSTGRDTFELVGHMAFGEACRKATIALVFVICWLSQIAYFVLLADLLVPIVQHVAPAMLTAFDVTGSRRVVLAVATVLLSPMCFKSSLSVMRFLCFASVGSVLFVGGVITFRSASAEPSHYVMVVSEQVGHANLTCHVGDAYALWPEDWLKALYVFPMFGVSFLCHFNALPTHQELRQPTRYRIRCVLALTVGLTALLYLSVGLFGYLYAGPCTCGNILLNFAAHDMLALCGRLMLGVVLMLNFPLILQPCRNALYRMLLITGAVGQREGSADDAAPADAPLHAQPEPAAHGGGAGGHGDELTVHLHAREPAARCTLESLPSGAELSACAAPGEPPRGLLDGPGGGGAAGVRAVSPKGPPASPGPTSPGAARVHVYARESTRRFRSRDALPLQALDTYAPKDETVQQGACEPTALQRYVLTVLLLVTALGVACFMQSILVVWSILGSTVAFLIGFILPVAFWLKIVGHEHTPRKRCAARLLLVVSVVLAVACTVLTCLHLSEPPCPLGEARPWMPPSSEALLVMDRQFHA